MEGDEITIKVEDNQFVVRKQVLCEHSDYFRAMFSGNFKEFEQQEININIVDATSMRIITEYLENDDAYNLMQHSLQVVGHLAEAAQKLQFTKLASHIESFLISHKINTKNIFDIWAIAQHIISYPNLRQRCNEIGVPLLRDMELQNVPSIQELVWYLSQTHQDVTNEATVFKFGLDWLSYSNTVVNSLTLLMLLGCLDIKRVKINDLEEIKKLCEFVNSFDVSFATDVVSCLIELSKNDVITKDKIVESKTMIEDKYTKTVYDEVLKLVKYSRTREPKYTPIVPVCESYLTNEHDNLFRLLDRQPYTPKNTTIRHAGTNLHIFKDTGLEHWLELKIPKANHRLQYITWSIAAWGARNLVLVTSKCQKICENDHVEYDQESSSTTIEVYNVLTKEWTDHGVNLSQGIVRRVAIVGDFLYIICGFGQNIVYDLIRKIYRTIARLPFEVRFHNKRKPLICVHNNEVYISNYKIIFKYDEMNNDWAKIIEHPNEISNIVSHNDGYIYVVNNRNLLRFKPGDQSMEVVETRVENKYSKIVHICSMEDRLLFFINEIISNKTPQNDRILMKLISRIKDKQTIYVNEYSTLDVAEGLYKELWSLKEPGFEFDDDAFNNTCKIDVSTPTIEGEVTEYLKQCLAKYNEQELF